VSRALLDDHLLRDLLADDVPRALTKLLEQYQPATTNHYLYRLCKSVVSARGGALTGRWTAEQRRALGSELLSLPGDIEVVPMRTLAFRMAEISAEHRVSTLGAECVAASEHLDAPVFVWTGDDGPGIRAAMKALRRPYRTIRR
jgi:hypothetical protein